MTRIGIVAEASGENRVAATPTTVPKLIALGYNGSVAVALLAAPLAHERLLMVTLRTAKRLQRIVACHICNVAVCVPRNQRVRLRERCKILREQAWQRGAGYAKWPHNF